MKTFLAFCFLIISVCALRAQDVMPAFDADNSSDFLLDFNEWKRGVSLEDAKAWKWYARHKAYEASRMNPHNQFPNMGEAWRTMHAVSVSKKQLESAARSGSPWSPVGPVNRPGAFSQYASHNMGRINCLAFHPSDSNIIYVGVAQGGVWKSENHGQTWRPLTDDLPIIRISDIAINPKNPDEIFICMGDYAYLGVALNTDGRKRQTHYGTGIYRSIDGGENWSPTGLGFALESLDAGLMRRVLFDSLPGRIVAAGVSGVWESADHGATWNQILDSLIWDLEQDFQNPNVFYASTGYVHNLRLGSAGVLKSIDYGRTWRKLNTGIPTKQAQRIELAISPSDSNYVYAIACGIDRGLQGVYQSMDAGDSWSLKASQPNILEWSDGSGAGGQGTYDLALLVHPKNPEIVYSGGVNVWGSEDGAQTWKGASYWYHRDTWSTHADQHFFAFNPLDNKYYVCNDGGLYRTDSIALTDWSFVGSQPWNYRWPTNWENISNGLQITAFYRLAISEGNPGNVIAGAQDNGTFYRNAGVWNSVFGGDGMDCMLDPQDPNTIYMSSQFGNLVRSRDGGRQRSSIANFPGAEEGEWTTPMAMNSKDSRTIYAGLGNVFRSSNQGSQWTSLTNFPQMQGFGAPNLISCMAISDKNSDKIYIGKRVYFEYNEPSKIWKLENGMLTDISSGLPDSLYPTSLEIHETSDNTAWLTYGGFVSGIKVFETNDGGQNWRNISDSLPNIPVNCIRRQKRSGYNTLYLGTDIGVYYKNDTTNYWRLYSEGLPNVIISDLELHYSEEKIYASSFGRGIWYADLLDTSAVAPVDTQVVNPPTSSLFRFEKLEAFDIYPNPNLGSFNLELSGDLALKFKVQITDVSGRIMHETSEVMDSHFMKSYDLDLASGLYF